jgi:hypothetical protein
MGMIELQEAIEGKYADLERDAAAIYHKIVDGISNDLPRFRAIAQAVDADDLTKASIETAGKLSATIRSGVASMLRELAADRSNAPAAPPAEAPAPATVPDPSPVP